MTPIANVRNLSTAISYFCDIVGKWCIESAMTCNVMCAMISCGMQNWIDRYRCKRPKQNPWFLKWSHQIVKIYLCSGSCCFMYTIKISWVGSIFGGPFLLVYTYASVPNDNSLCYSSSVSFLVYVSVCFVEAGIGNPPMWQLLYVGINPG